MSTHSVATLPRLSSTSLSQLLLAQTSSSNLDAPATSSKLAIVDVRDDDHIGGHIRTSLHVPSSTLDYKIPELVRKLKEKDTVVFHCALSQQRGPSAALRYVRARERLLGLGVGSGVGESLKKNKAENVEVEEGKEGEWVDVGEGKKEQKVYVLDRGFVGWQEVYGEDTRLTEGYRKEIWKDGY